MPSWVIKWLIINTVVVVVDGLFCVLRPHSFPDGCLGFLFLTYKWYIAIDKHYADPKDSFTFSVGLGNLIEGTVYLLVLFNVFKSVRLNKMLTMLTNMMTAHKTIIFLVYYIHADMNVQDGRVSGSIIPALLIFGGSSIWVLVPAYVTWVLMQDFVGKPKGTSSKTEFAADDSTEDSVDGTGNRRYNLRNR